jgi:hypothetical protein
MLRGSSIAMPGRDRLLGGSAGRPH